MCTITGLQSYSNQPCVGNCFLVPTINILAKILQRFNLSDFTNSERQFRYCKTITFSSSSQGLTLSHAPPQSPAPPTPPKPLPSPSSVVISSLSSSSSTSVYIPPPKSTISHGSISSENVSYFV
ncbi:hypothetical protein RIF29_07324 [Crotalaria pallida]|uniref:Uncharacterized protein n=1 Tax=Crotalaria pallida TaxID=3830 RepID=A0AAN9J4D0_CROPI